jgi:putative protease
MKSVCYLKSLDQIDLFVKEGVNEVILATTLFSRVGFLSREDLLKAFDALAGTGIRLIFEWDILMTEDVFQTTVREFESLDLTRVDSFRLIDPGAISYILKNDKRPIQINLESSAFHNLLAIKTWLKTIGSRVERIVLSLELDKDTISEYVNELDIDVEYLVIGKILLFYTPRNLLTPIVNEPSNKEWIEVNANSEESPHKGFPIIENRHGTFMFNTKDHFLLDYIEEVESTGVGFIRVDSRFIDDDYLKEVFRLFRKPENVLGKSLKERYPVSTIRGFFHKNKSDVLFKKLKNHRLIRTDKNYLGEVIEVSKKNHIGIFIRSHITNLIVGSTVLLITPDGKEKESVVTSLVNSVGENISSLSYGDIIFIPHVSGISVRTNVYLA